MSNKDSMKQPKMLREVHPGPVDTAKADRCYPAAFPTASKLREAQINASLALLRDELVQAASTPGRSSITIDRNTIGQWEEVRRILSERGYTVSTENKGKGFVTVTW